MTSPEDSTDAPTIRYVGVFEEEEEGELRFETRLQVLGRKGAFVLA